jgi:hypothetical protein
MLNSGDTASGDILYDAGLGTGQQDPVLESLLRPHTVDQAREYLARVVPWPAEGEEGYVALQWTVANPKGGRPFWKGRAVRSVDEAARALTWALGRQDTRDVYTCLSLQRNAKEVVTQTGYRFLAAERSAAAAISLKSLFLDIDVGKQDGYAAMKQASAALSGFIQKINLPRVSTLVHSGGGLHVYWTFDRALTVAEWKPLAHALVNAAKEFRLKFDAGCTIDAARVLRVPNTFNRKLDTPRPVVLLGADRQHMECSVKEITEVLKPYIQATPVTLRVTNKRLDPTIFPPKPPIPPTELSAGIDANLEEIRSAVGAIPPAAIADEGDWVRFARALAHTAAIHSLQAEELWGILDEASQRAPGYDHDENRQRWLRYIDEAFDRDTPITIATIFDMAKRHGRPGWSPPIAERGILGQVPHVDAVSLARRLDVVDEAESLDGVDPLDFVTTTVDDAVQRINGEYFYRRDTSEICRQDAISGEIQVLSPQQFKTALAGRWVEAVDPKTGRMKMRDSASAWLESRRRREVHGVQYCPNNSGLRHRHLNLWLGWGLEPVPGDCSLVLDHTLRVVAGGNQQKAEFILNWFADILQNPTRKPGVALVLHGSEGTGKSVLGAIMRRVLGERNVLVNADKDRLLGRFNSALAGKILIQAEESFFAGDSRTGDALKHVITGQTLEVELKFGRSFQVDSFHRLLITSNHLQVIQASSESRRFVVCDVADTRRGDADYFDRLYAVADGRDDVTARAFMQHLLDRDLSTFKPWAAQQQFLGDDALVRQKVLSLSPPLAWLWELLEDLDADRPADCAPPLKCWYERQEFGGKGITRFYRSQAIGHFRAWAKETKPMGRARTPVANSDSGGRSVE